MTTPKLKILRVEFDAKIQRSELPAFRGAVAAAVPRDRTLFHQHEQDGSLRYAYPLIQYKVFAHNKPGIVCLGKGVDEIHHFFQRKNWDLHISDRALDMKIGRLDMNQFNLNVWEKDFHYQIHQWLPLGKEKYEQYQKLDSLADRIALLERTLVGNILSFAKGIGWRIDKQIEVAIKDIDKTHTAHFKNQKHLALTVSFKSNVFLPNFIGLGRKTAFGYGVVREQRGNNGGISNEK